MRHRVGRAFLFSTLAFSLGAGGCSGGAGSSADAGPGDGGGGGDAGAINAMQIAQRVAAAQCAYAQRCSPATFDLLKLTQATCVSKQMDRTRDYFDAVANAVAAGRIRYSPSTLDECERLNTVADCNLGILDNEACGRFFVGGQPLNAACLLDEECSSDAFCTSSVGVCGKCTPRALSGQSCDNATCAENASCLQPGPMAARICVSTSAALNAPCGTAQTGLCRGALSCVGPATGSTCKPPAALNAPCDPNEVNAPTCNQGANLVCDNGTCKTITWSGPGGACNGTTQLCNVEGACPMGGGTCAGLPRAGMPCSTRANLLGNVCEEGAFCLGGTCTQQKPSGASCNQSIECAGSLVCSGAGATRACTKITWMQCN